MGIKLSDLGNVQRTISFEYDGFKLDKVVFRPNVLTPKFQNESISDRTMTEFLVYTLSHLLVSWDITNDGEPVLPTSDILEQLPLSFLDALYGAIMENLRPNPKKSGSFGAG